MISNAEFSVGLYRLKVKNFPINSKCRTCSPKCRSTSSVEPVSYSNKDSIVML